MDQVGSMDTDKKIVYVIPKDPRTHHATFLTGLPYALKDLVGEEEWRHTIDGLNRIMVAKESPTLWSLLRILFIFPILLGFSTYDDDARKYIDSINKELVPRGILIRDPSYNNYIELEVIVTIK